MMSMKESVFPVTSPSPSDKVANDTGPKVGSRVVGMVIDAYTRVNAGAWAEQVAVPTNMLAKIPANVTFAQAATLPVAGPTALRALEKGGLLLHKRVLITGSTGGVGLYAHQLARQSGAYVAETLQPSSAILAFLSSSMSDI